MSTSVSHPTTDAQPPQPAAPVNRRLLRVAIIVIGAGLMSLVMWVAVRTQGHVSGQEFSPSHFQVREFHFYEIPLLHVQITPIKRSSQTPTAARYLQQKSLIASPAGPPTSWHLVHLTRGLTGPTPGDAGLLVEQLSLEPTGKSYWRQWSGDHPAQAQLLWPVVQRLAERELYLLIPALLEIAQQEQPAAELKANIARYLRQEYHDLVRDLRAAGRDALAEQLLSEALADYPDDQPLQRLRSRAPTSPSVSP